MGPTDALCAQASVTILFVCFFYHWTVSNSGGGCIFCCKSRLANLVEQAPGDKFDCIFIGIIIFVFCNSILPQSTWRCCCKKTKTKKQFQDAAEAEITEDGWFHNSSLCLQHIMWVAIKIAGELSWRGRFLDGFTFGTRTSSFVLFGERFCRHCCQ